MSEGKGDMKHTYLCTVMSIFWWKMKLTAPDHKAPWVVWNLNFIGKAVLDFKQRNNLYL